MVRKSRVAAIHTCILTCVHCPANSSQCTQRYHEDTCKPVDMVKFRCNSTNQNIQKSGQHQNMAQHTHTHVWMCVYTGNTTQWAQTQRHAVQHGPGIHELEQHEVQYTTWNSQDRAHQTYKLRKAKDRRAFQSEQQGSGTHKFRWQQLKLKHITWCSATWQSPGSFQQVRIYRTQGCAHNMVQRWVHMAASSNKRQWTHEINSGNQLRQNGSNTSYTQADSVNEANMQHDTQACNMTGKWSKAVKWTSAGTTKKHTRQCSATKYTRQKNEHIYIHTCMNVCIYIYICINLCIYSAELHSSRTNARKLKTTCSNV